MAEPTRLVGALLVRQDRLLLGRRSPWKVRCPDSWDLFGGHVEIREGWTQALARELDEELGVTPTQAREIAWHRLEDRIEYRVFAVRAWSGGEPAIRNDEHTALGWFTREEVRRLDPLASDAYRDLLLTALGPR